MKQIVQISEKERGLKTNGKAGSVKAADSESDRKCRTEDMGCLGWNHRNKTLYILDNVNGRLWQLVPFSLLCKENLSKAKTVQHKIAVEMLQSANIDSLVLFYHRIQVPSIFIAIIN